MWVPLSVLSLASLKHPKNDIKGAPVCLPSASGDFLPSLGTQGE